MLDSVSGMLMKPRLHNPFQHQLQSVGQGFPDHPSRSWPPTSSHRKSSFVRATPAAPTASVHPLPQGTDFPSPWPWRSQEQSGRKSPPRPAPSCFLSCHLHHCCHVGLWRTLQGTFMWLVVCSVAGRAGSRLGLMLPLAVSKSTLRGRPTRAR